MTYILKRLRDAKINDSFGYVDINLQMEAADEIERLTYELSKARASVIEECAKVCDREGGKQFALIGIATNKYEAHKHGAKTAMAMELAAYIRLLPNHS